MTAKDGGGEHLAILSVNEDGAGAGNSLHDSQRRSAALDAVFDLSGVDGARLDELIASAQEKQSLEAMDDALRGRLRP